jgi:hypothetical protein
VVRFEIKIGPFSKRSCLFEEYLSVVPVFSDGAASVSGAYMRRERKLADLLSAHAQHCRELARLTPNKRFAAALARMASFCEAEAQRLGKQLIKNKSSKKPNGH